jgi:hypothetical protein
MTLRMSIIEVILAVVAVQVNMVTITIPSVYPQKFFVLIVKEEIEERKYLVEGFRRLNPLVAVEFHRT